MFQAFNNHDTETLLSVDEDKNDQESYGTAGLIVTNCVLYDWS